MFAITTISCNDRQTLFKTIEMFLQNTHYDKLNWYIYLQGNTEKYIDKFKQYIQNFDNIIFHLIINEKNIGLSKGVNELNENVKEYKYVLHIEDDWACLAENKNWLNTCLNFMEIHTDISTLYLRKYSNNEEKFQFGWTRNIKYQCHKYKDNFNYAEKMKKSHIIMYEEIKFQHIPKCLFTFNPTIRRNKDYYDNDIFPLLEFDDISNKKNMWKLTQEHEIKDWGWCEALTMEKTINLKTYNVANGIFGHYENFFE